MKPVPQVGPAIFSAIALSSTPVTPSLSAIAVEKRTPQASGNSAFETVPGGLVMLSGRKVPVFGGMSGSRVWMKVMIRRVSMSCSLPPVGML